MMKRYTGSETMYRYRVLKALAENSPLCITTICLKTRMTNRDVSAHLHQLWLRHLVKIDAAQEFKGVVKGLYSLTGEGRIVYEMMLRLTDTEPAEVIQR